MAIASPFPSPNFQPMIPAQTGVGLVPAAGYKAKFFAAGTDIPKTIYTDADLTVPYASPSNIAFLDDDGKALIYLGTGGYKLVLTDPNDNPVAGWTIDNIVGAGSFSTGFAANFAALTSVNTTLNTYTYIPGYYTAGDGGEGMFYNAVSSDSPDGGYVQESDYDVTKRWFRIPDENGDVRAASFGYCGSGDLTANLLAADAYAASISARLRIQNDPCTTTTITLTSPVVVFNSGATLYAGASAALTINGIVEAGGWRIFSPDWTSVTLANVKQESRPEWFGASLTNSAADNVTAMASWQAAGAGTYMLPAGDWPYTGTFPTVVIPTIFYGKLNGLRQGVQFHSTDSTADFGNHKMAGTGAIITGDGNTGAKTDNDWTVDGLNKGKAGTGTKYYRVGGSLGRYTSTTQTGTAFTGSTTKLFSITIPANTLIATGDSLKVKVQGWASGDMSANLGAVNLAFGETAITSGGFISLSASSTAEFGGEATIVRTSATTVQVYYNGFCIGGGTVPFSAGNTNSAPITIESTGWNATQSLHVTGSSVTGGSRVAYLQFVDVSFSGNPS